jgi:hypothetical protein
MVCELPYDWPDCVFLVKQGIAKAIAGNPPARRVVVKLTRSFLGIARNAGALPDHDRAAGAVSSRQRGLRFASSGNDRS